MERIKNIISKMREYINNSKFSLTQTCFGTLSSSQYFCNLRKKGPRLKWTIYKHISDNSKKYLTVGNFGIMPVFRYVCRYIYRSVCRASTTYNSLCRGLKYLLKVGYITLNFPNMAWFLILETLCLGRANTLTYVWKNITKMNGIWVW